MEKCTTFYFYINKFKAVFYIGIKSKLFKEYLSNFIYLQSTPRPLIQNI